MHDAVPDDIARAFQAGGATEPFGRLPPWHQREYLTWISEAKRPETRSRRIARTVMRLCVAKDSQ